MAYSASSEQNPKFPGIHVRRCSECQTSMPWSDGVFLPDTFPVQFSPAANS